MVIRTKQCYKSIVDNHSITKACHLSNNLYNEANYLVRQEFFNNKSWLRYTELNKLLRVSNNYKILPKLGSQGYDAIVKDENGEISEIHCTYDEDSKSGSGSEASKRKVKGTIHWVSAKHAIDAQVNLYDRLFTHPNPAAADDFTKHLNPESLTVLNNCKLEPALADASPDIHYQFERTGYFVKDNNAESLTFNRTVTLRDTWAKLDKQNQ